MLVPTTGLGDYDATSVGAESLERICEWMSRRGAGERHPALLWAAVELLDVVRAGHLREEAARRTLRRAAEKAWAPELLREGPEGPTALEIAGCLDWASVRSSSR